jgi:hypothetical protein
MNASCSAGAVRAGKAVPRMDPAMAAESTTAHFVILSQNDGWQMNRG